MAKKSKPVTYDEIEHIVATSNLGYTEKKSALESLTLRIVTELKSAPKHLSESALCDPRLIEIVRAAAQVGREYERKRIAALIGRGE